MDALRRRQENEMSVAGVEGEWVTNSERGKGRKWAEEEEATHPLTTRE